MSQACSIAAKNKQEDVDTVVFFDEANTSDAIGLMKEILCDRRINGKPIPDYMKFIVACNPYRRSVIVIGTSMPFNVFEHPLRPQAHR